MTLRRLVRNHRSELRLLAAMLGLLAALASVVAFSSTVTRLDLLTVQGLHAASLPSLTVWVFAVTDLGSTQTILTVGMLATGAFAVLRQWRAAVSVGLSVAITQGLVAVLKHAAERPRPPARDALMDAAGFSFPSGHAAASMALYALLAYLAARHLRGAPRVAVLVTGATLVVFIGLSRIYLGAHYPTDVMAGWLVGGALAVTSWLIACVLWPLVPRTRTPRLAA